MIYLLYAALLFAAFLFAMGLVAIYRTATRSEVTIPTDVELVTNTRAGDWA